MHGGITKRQDLLADYLLDPRVKTQREAGRLAGYADTHSLDSIVSVAIRNDKFLELLDKRRAEQSDTGLGFRALVRRLQRLQTRALAAVEKQLDKLERDDGIDIQTAGSLSKLFSDLQVNAGKLQESMGEDDDAAANAAALRSWKRHLHYCFCLGVALVRRYGPEGALGWADRVPDHVERRIFRSRNDNF